MQNNISNWQGKLHVLTNALNKTNIGYEVFEDDNGAFIQDDDLNFTILVCENNEVVFEANACGDYKLITRLSSYLIGEGIKIDAFGLYHQPDNELHFDNEADEKPTVIIANDLNDNNHDYDEIMHSPMYNTTVH